MIPNRASLNGVTFKNVCQKAADHLVQTIDGKQKEFETSTYANVKNILKNIQKSNYFDKAEPPSTDISENADENGEMGENGDIANNVDEPSVNQTNISNAEPNTTNSSVAQPSANVHQENHEVFTEQTNNKIEAPSASAVPVPTFAPPPPPPQHQPLTQQLPQPQQPHAIPAPGINVAKNVKTIPQGLYRLVFSLFFLHFLFGRLQFLSNCSFLLFLLREQLRPFQWQPVQFHWPKYHQLAIQYQLALFNQQLFVLLNKLTSNNTNSFNKCAHWLKSWEVDISISSKIPNWIHRMFQTIITPQHIQPIDSRRFKLGYGIWSWFPSISQ